MTNTKGAIQFIAIISIIIILVVVSIVYAVTTGQGGILGYTNDPESLTIKQCEVTVKNPLIGKPVIVNYQCADTHARCLTTIPRTLGIFSEKIKIKMIGYDSTGVQSAMQEDELITTEDKVYILKMCSQSKNGGVILYSKEHGQIDARDVKFQ